MRGYNSGSTEGCRGGESSTNIRQAWSWDEVRKRGVSMQKGRAGGLLTSRKDRGAKTSAHTIYEPST